MTKCMTKENTKEGSNIFWLYVNNVKFSTNYIIIKHDQNQYKTAINLIKWNIPLKLVFFYEICIFIKSYAIFI